MSLRGPFPQRREGWDSFVTRDLKNFITSMKEAKVEVINEESKKEILDLLSIFTRSEKDWQIYRFFNNSIPEEWREEARQNEKVFNECLASINNSFEGKAIKSTTPFERIYHKIKLGKIKEAPGLTLICSFLDEVLEWTYGL